MQSFLPCARRHARAPLALTLALGLLLGPALTTPARAATLTVTTTADSGTGSLRAAIATADKDGGNDTITFSLPAGSKITVGSTLNVTAPMTIQGPGASSLAIDGGNTNGAANPNGVKVFLITTSANNQNDGPGGTVTVSGLTIQNGNAYSDGYLYSGGGILLFSGNLILTDCVLSGNTSEEGGGLAVYSTGAATVTGCTFTGNSATSSANDGFGGGVVNLFGTLTLTGCTFTGNSATCQDNQGGGEGGAVSTVEATTLIDCTLTGNSAVGGGGGIQCALAQSGEQLTIENCTLVDNTDIGVYGDVPTTLTNDIIYGNTVIDVDVSSPTVSHCDIGTGYTTGTNGNISADPLLSALGSYGGPTQTFALLPGSPCLGAGVAVPGVTADQRGVAIPQAHGYDIGAFESQGFIVYIESGGGQTTQVNTDFPQPIQAEVASRSGAEPVAGGTLSFVAPASGASATIFFYPADIGSDGSVSVEATANSTVGGPYSVTAETGAGSSNPFSLTNVADLDLVVTANPSPSTYGQRVTITGALSGGINPTGTITYYDGPVVNGMQIGAVQTVTGDGIYSVSTSSLSAGDHTIVAVYKDSNNFSGRVRITLTVNPVTPQLDVNANPSESVFGQSVTLRATLSSGISPTGTVTFYDGPVSNGIQIGAAQTVTGNGPYSVTTSSLSVANHTINAVYSGDTDNSGSTKSTGENVLKDNTTTTVGSSANPSTAGQSVTFTATVTANAPGAGTPTGTVTFTVDNVAQTPVALTTVGGKPQAAFSTSTLGVGPHTVSAAYNGDPDSNTSHSSLSPSQQVNAGIGTPTANPQTVSVGYKTATNITLTGSDPDSPALPLTYALATQPQHGALSGFNSSTGAVTYTPTAGYSGPDSFTFTVNNGANTSAPATVTLSVAAPPAATHLSVTTTTTMTTAGTAFSVTVTAQDSGGNTVPGYTGPVHFSSTDGQALLPANYTFTSTDAGTHTFSVTLKTAGNKTVTATDTVTSALAGTTGQVLVSAAPAAKLAVSAPTTATAGKSFQVTVASQDPYGNPASSTATVSFTSTDPRAVPPAPVALSNGTATVNIMYFTAGQQTLTAAATSLTSGTALTTVSSDPAGTPSVAVSNVTLTRTNSTTVTVSFTLVNTGVGQASGVHVTVAKLGTINANSLGSTYTLGAGQSQDVSLTFTGVAAGANTLTLNGAYTNAAATTSYAFSGGKKVTVP